MAAKTRRIRPILRQIHLWIGVALCLPLLIQGLTGVTMVISDLLTDGAAVSSRPLSHRLSEIIDAAAQVAPKGMEPTQLILPGRAGDLVTVRLGSHRRAGRGSRMEFAVDPASLAVTKTHPGFLRFVHSLHENLLIEGRTGRSIVGCYGIGMLLLGLSGIVIWWPSRGRWKAAFLIARNAGTRRLLRDLHALTGFMGLISLMVISFTGVYLAYPQTMGTLFGMVNKDADRGPKVDVIDGTDAIDADAVLTLANAAVPGSSPRMVALPQSDEQPYRVMLAQDAGGGPPVTVFVDPWQKKVSEIRDPQQLDLGPRMAAWVHSVHEGRGLGSGWRAIVIATGLMPPFLGVTGVIMWFMRPRRPRSRPPRARQALTKELTETEA